MLPVYMCGKCGMIGDYNTIKAHEEKCQGGRISRCGDCVYLQLTSDGRIICALHSETDIKTLGNVCDKYTIAV